MADSKPQQPECSKAVEALFQVPLFRKCLDTSITGKLLGMLTVSLFGLMLLSSMHTWAISKVNTRVDEIQTLAVPQYKVSQFALRQLNGFKISLLNIINPQENATSIDLSNNILANSQRLDNIERMFTTLKLGGTIQDITRISQETLDAFPVSPAPKGSPLATLVDEVLEIIAEVQTNFEYFTGTGNAADVRPHPEAIDEVTDTLDDLYDELTDFALFVTSSYNTSIEETGGIIDRSFRNGLLTSFITAIVLVVGTFLYILLIVSPLKTILENIKGIAKGEGDLAQAMCIKTHDEVGQLAKQLNILVENIYALNSFKNVIEEEESTIDVQKRLATLLHERYWLDPLFIYEVTGTKHTMNLAFASDHNKICDEKILDNCNLCRAKRTGHPISSIEFPEICKVFPHGATMEHHCIPMIAGGAVIGIVQFLISKDASQDELNDFSTKVKRAKRYIKEATPVIEAKRFAAALQETTLKDPMTGLYNRRFLETYVDTLIASTMRRRSTIGIMMCDMDFFKEVNDSYGHEAGDEVLIKTAEILSDCVRQADMVIRFGGEEFLIILNDIEDREATAELGERIRLTVEDSTFSFAGGNLKKTISIGYSMFPDDSEGFWEALKYADVALYQAKHAGRNMVVGFTPEMWDQDTY